MLMLLLLLLLMMLLLLPLLLSRPRSPAARSQMPSIRKSVMYKTNHHSPYSLPSQSSSSVFITITNFIVRSRSWCKSLPDPCQCPAAESDPWRLEAMPRRGV